MEMYSMCLATSYDARVIVGCAGCRQTACMVSVWHMFRVAMPGIYVACISYVGCARRVGFVHAGTCRRVTLHIAHAHAELQKRLVASQRTSRLRTGMCIQVHGPLCGSHRVKDTQDRPNSWASWMVFGSGAQGSCEYKML